MKSFFGVWSTKLDFCVLENVKKKKLIDSILEFIKS